MARGGPPRLRGARRRPPVRGAPARAVGELGVHEERVLQRPRRGDVGAHRPARHARGHLRGAADLDVRRLRHDRRGERRRLHGGARVSRLGARRFGGPGGQIGGIKYMQEGGDTKEQRMPREPRRPSGILEFLESDKPIFSPFGFGADFDTKLEILKKLGFITTAQQGGEMDCPRRDGGIDPSEGSGTKDDVPAMLTAGDFVLTKDAVKGLGNGNQRLGIQRAYDMMGQLERMA